MLRKIFSRALALAVLVLAALPGVAAAAQAALPAGPAPLSALARIASPTAGQHVSGQVPIVGAANWPSTAIPPYNFMSYTLDWGAGSAPESFNTFDFVQVPSDGGQLAVWNTAGLPDGPYVIRLSVANHTGNYAVVRVPVIVDNSGTYSGADFPVSLPAAQPAGKGPSAVIRGSSSYSDPTSGQLHIVGEIQNNGSTNLQFVQVTATFKDAAGNPIQNGMAFTLLPTLVPGQKSPFDIFTISPANVGGTADLAVTFSQAANPPLGGLAISGDRLAFDAQGKLHLTGDLTNSARDPSVPFHIVYTIYDASGTPIRAGTFATITSSSGAAARLDTGTSGTFDYVIPNPPSSFGSYSLAVQ